MMADQFIGSWALVSSIFKGEDGAIHHPLGEQVLGRLNYEANGTMAAQLYSATRPRFASEDLAQGSDREIRPAFVNMLCYFGRYRIDEGKQCAIHRVEGCSFPNWLGSQQIRFYSFTDDKLTLRTVPLLLDNRVQIGELVWQRLQAAEGEKS